MIASSSFDRLSLVSSFYGPGNITAWLCTLASVFITWCFNIDYRNKDSISTDLIFALTVPGVAAGHVIYLLFYFQHPDVDKHETVTLYELFTSREPAIVQHAAAAEAALNVCETFATAAVVLTFIAMLNNHLKRAIGTATVGLLAFSTETIIFFKTGGIGVSVSNLSRPLTFDFSGVMVPFASFLSVWTFVFFALVAWQMKRNWNPRQQNGQVEHAKLPSEAELRMAAVYEAETTRSDGERIKILTIGSIFFLPISFSIALVSGSGGMGETDFMSALHWSVRLAFFIPRTATALTELDQVVSFCIGIVTLLYSVRDAYLSQQRETERRAEAARDREGEAQKRRQKRDLTWKLRRLRQLHNELDQTHRKEERQALVEEYNRSMAEVSEMLGLAV